MSGRSHCDFCESTLNWWELIPVVGTVLLHGRCSHCGAYYGYVHATAEATLGLAYVVIYRAIGLTPYGVTYVIICTVVEFIVLWVIRRK